MKRIGKKVASLIITLFIVSLLAFLAFQIIPGDPTTKILGTNASPEKVAQLRNQLGLDRPVLIRYWDCHREGQHGEKNRHRQLVRQKAFHRP